MFFDSTKATQLIIMCVFSWHYLIIWFNVVFLTQDLHWEAFHPTHLLNRVVVCVCACRHSPWCDSFWDALKRDLSRETWQRDMVQFNGTPPPAPCVSGTGSLELRITHCWFMTYWPMNSTVTNPLLPAVVSVLAWESVWLLPAPWICMSGNRKKNKTLLVIAFFLFCNAKSLIIMLYDYSGTFFLCVWEIISQVLKWLHTLIGLCFLKSWREKTQSSHLWSLFILKWK